MTDRAPGRGRGSVFDADVAHAQGPVLIAGMSSPLDSRLAHRIGGERKVIGVGQRSVERMPEAVAYHRIDLRSKKLQDVFRTMRPSAVVYLGGMSDWRTDEMERHEANVAGFHKLLELVAQYEVSKLVVLSSASVYGPRFDNAQLIAEDAPLLGDVTYGELRDAIQIDTMAQSTPWKHAQTELVVLRSVHVLGAMSNAVSNYLRLDVIPTLLGYDPMMQVIHHDDVVRAIHSALRPGINGVYNLAGPAPVPLSQIVALTGKRHMAVPYSLLRAAVQRLSRLGATSFRAPELEFIRYVCMVDDRRIRNAMGYVHEHGVEEAVRSVNDAC